MPQTLQKYVRATGGSQSDGEKAHTGEEMKGLVVVYLSLSLSLLFVCCC